MKTKILLAVLLAAAAARARAGTLDARAASRIADSALGVDLAGLEKGAAVSTRTAALVDLYAQAGVKWARVRPEWADVETSTGVYDDADVDALVQRLFDRGVKVLMTLDGRGQKLYADGAAPTAADGALEPWLAWVSSMTARYQTAVTAWQVWDEPARDWSPEASTAAYSALFRPTADAIRAARPGAVVLLGGADDADRDFLRGAVAADEGLADAIDVRLPADEGAEEHARAFKSLRVLLSSAAFPVPAIWIGADAARPDAAEDSGAEPESAAVRAKRLARAEVLALAEGAARRFSPPLLDRPGGEPIPETLTVLRSLAVLFDDRAAASLSLTASFKGAPKGLVSASFETQSGAPLLAFWSEATLGEDDAGRPAVASLSQPVRDPVLVDPLSGETTSLGSGTLTTLSVPVRDYPLIVTAASVLKEAATALLVSEETEAFPNPVRGGEKVSLRYFLTEPAPVTIEIFTSRRELLRAATFPAPAGRGVWTWSADVGAGTYYWRVSARGQSLVGKLVVLR
jgi:hypothetical protein